MATNAQIQKLRRKIQDFYSKRTGAELSASEQAFKDDELQDIIDDAFAEVTDGLRDANEANALDEAMMILVARADAILQIAQDEARRIKWQVNNEIIDPESIAKNLLEVAKALQQRYENYRKRKLQEEINGISVKTSPGSRMDFNSSVTSGSERNFDNSVVNRNRPQGHNL